uniref:TSA: Wollemia nobilis Ref_Wollemi_Transcript_3322_1541 transcribed RNA sequence n=1 Tax=Wollemia nobilis TaxID=56998 RepID=A0A0C9S8V9_9CONI
MADGSKLQTSSPPQGVGMEECDWNFGPSVTATREDGGIRGILTHLMSHMKTLDEGKKVIPLGHGDPSQFECYRVAKEVEDALIRSIHTRKYNGYPPPGGIPDSRRAVAEYLSPGLPYKLAADDVYLTGGCRQAMEVVLAILSRKDANILLPRPGYPLYDVLLAYNGIQARHYNLIPERGWEADLDHVEEIADSNTVAIVLINPNNPCGVVFSHDHLAKLAETAKRLGLLIIADEVYSPMVFGDKPFVPMGLFATIVPVITLGSISKRWLVPGWRLGWIVTCDPRGILKETQITEAIGKYLDLVASPATIVQVKIDMSGFEDLSDDVGFCITLAKEESVIILPGSCLGMKNWMRISFAVSPSLLEEAWDRVESFCQRHAKYT